MQKFFAKRKDEMKKISSLIYSDYFLNDYVFFFGPGIYYFDKERFYKRAKYISDYFTFNEKKISYFYLNNEYFLINNNTLKYIKLKSINCNNKERQKIFQQVMFCIKTLTNLSNLIYKNNCKEIIYKNINDNEFKLNLVGYNEYTSKMK